MDHFKADVWFSPAAVVADSDAVQASDGEGTEGQSDKDDVKHSELCRKHENNYFTQKKTHRNFINWVKLNSESTARLKR